MTKWGFGAGARDRVPHESTPHKVHNRLWGFESNPCVTVIFLAFTALRLTRKNNRVGYLLLLALLGIGMSLGRFSGIFMLFHNYFPFFRFIRYPARFFFLFNFAAACLAGFGFDRVLSRTEETKEGATIHGRVFFVFFLAITFPFIAANFDV